MSIQEKENITPEEQQKKKGSGRIKKSFRSRQFKSGAYSTFITVLVIAIVVVINMVFSKLELSTDLSKGSLFTLSKETKKVLKGNEKDVILYYMVENGDEEEYINNVLKQYSKVSKHVSLKKVDPVINPAFASQYDITDEISSNDVIVVNKETKAAKYVASTAMYYSDMDYTSGSQYRYLDVEGQITSAIQGVLATSKTKMYVAAGHSELEVAETMTKAYEKLNVESETLELLTAKEIPDDCDILLINGPTSDLTDHEKEIVLGYLKSGGDAIINLEYTTQKMPNLEEILEYYGVRSTQGVICETSGNYYYYPNFIVPTLGSGDLLSDLKGYFIIPNSVGLNTMKEIRSSLTVQEVLNTSDGSYLKVDPSSGSSEKESGDVDGPFAAGISVKEEIEGEEETNLVVYSSASAFDTQYVSTSQLENGELMKAAVRSMVKSDVKEASIDAKSLDYSYVQITPVMQLVWAALLIIILPLAILIIGCAIWMMRRRK